MILAILMLCATAPSPQQPAVDQVVDVAPVWSGHPVSFALLTHGKRQFVAFYDDQRRMTVASRTVDSRQWQFVRLPSAVGWDSHNSLTMAIDDAGLLHVIGNMHNVPLIYFRSEQPDDISTLRKVPAMIGTREHSCTYPHFFRGPDNELLFTYRDGRSGRGDQIWNVYDPKSQTWRRLMNEPLFSGQGKMNAYFKGPVRDRHGMFHVCWVWRNSGDCATNHDLCYARSKNLVKWETSDGGPLRLPITAETAEIVDPVPPGGGIINGNTRIGFDRHDRPILSYHKHDAVGNTQIYNARRENDGWKICQASNWNHRWEFSGGGSISTEIHVDPVRPGPAGTLLQSYWHVNHGSGTWRLDEATLKPLGEADAPKPLPKTLHQPGSDVPGMEVQWATDLGQSDEPGVHYSLRWETLPPNRDRPRSGPLPKPSMLRVHRGEG